MKPLATSRSATHPTDPGSHASPRPHMQRADVQHLRLLLVAAILYKLGFASVTVDKMNPRHDSGCIYCGSQGPFTDEHVVCAGLGGDDNEWLLTDCVCDVCNTEIFSKLETKFLRASPVAIARLFLQPRTRNQSGKTGAPSVQRTSALCLIRAAAFCWKGCSRPADIPGCCLSSWSWTRSIRHLPAPTQSRSERFSRNCARRLPAM